MISVRLQADDRQDAADIIRLVEKTGGTGHSVEGEDGFDLLLKWPDSVERELG